MSLLNPDDLLFGAGTTFEIAIPSEVLYPGENSPPTTAEKTVQLRPITISTFQLIMKAARQDTGLIPLLMIKESLVQPNLSLEQVKQLHLGLVNFLIEQIRQISGLTGKKNSHTP
ncbi:hypothetical protein [Nostoc sp. ChiQUE01b]|uniref:hypothetical protein n=1 Tax=Nostoc sp. ChiQUE01b TaxID=3075376 RepID=UPI002AD3E06F|nr:hypothetical protein [Nostoc sp. ChiQUE01b]MDZ8263307.1 hypothetical protein [Nostoc sp. ChiQUE01b]